MNKKLATEDDPAEVARIRMEEKDSEYQAGFLDGLEAAAAKVESMFFLLSLPNPEQGPFTKQDITVKEVIKQSAEAIRALSK